MVTRRLPDEVEGRLAERFDARLNPDDQPMDAAALRQAIAEADAVLCTVTDRLDATVLSASPRRARLLANFGVGHDHIDLAAARAAGLRVSNTPGVLTDDTADLTLMLMLMVLRRAGEGERLLRDGRWVGWAPTQLLGARLTGRTLGVVGFGRIGQAVARRASHGFGMRVLCHSRSPAEPAALASTGAEPAASLEALLRASDVVSLHVPATEETRHLINSGTLALLRPGAVLINTARGGIVDEEALAAALAGGRLAGAGLDVYEGEPVVHPALRRREDVVLLPHLGSATVETRVAMGLRALANIEAFFRGDQLPDEVP